MRTSSYKQFAIIREDSTEAFQERLNEKMQELRHCWPDVTFSEEGPYMIARIVYLQHDHAPEDLGDAYELMDVSFRCEDCPEFRPIRNKDGTLNARVKYGDCPHSQYGRTYKNSRACDLLYMMLRDGRIHLVKNEEEEER